jgi:hypothetical protein
MENTGYIDFLDGVLLFRGLRDSDTFPETWTERWLSTIVISNEPPEAKHFLRLMTKLAELIDDRKAWLLEEINNDLHKILIEDSSPVAA